MFSFLSIVGRLLAASRRPLSQSSPMMNAQLDAIRLSLEGAEIRTRMLLDRALQEGSGDPVPTLLAALEGPDEGIRSTAAMLLGDVAPSVTDSATRRAVIQALINALAIPPLLRETPQGVVIDLRTPLRAQAAEAVGKYHDHGAVLELTEALRSDQPRVRRAAAWALGEIGAVEAIDALGEALPERDGEARDAINLALRRIGTPEALAAIDAWKQTRGKGTP